MADIKVSICISVHNTGAYLNRCLNSIKNQTVNDFEIILVNNGSTDGSREIMGDFKSANPDLAITIIDQADLGLAQGRQSGVNVAAGEYISFLDADDYFLSDTCLEALYDEAVKNDCDIVEGLVRRDGLFLERYYSGIIDSKQVLRSFFFDGKAHTMLWMRLYRRKLFERVAFPKDYVNNEDNYVFPCLLHAANRICFTDTPFYNYSSDNENAVMNRLKTKSYDHKKTIENRIKLLKSGLFVRDFITEDVIKREYKSEFDSYICNLCIYFLTYKMKGLGMRKRIELIQSFYGLDKHELKTLYRSTNHPDSRFVKLTKAIGFYNAIRAIRIIKR